MRVAAAVLKRDIESKLTGRISGALSPLAQAAPRLHPVGNAAIDALLGGGLPLGTLCELTGSESSGRSTLALSLLANASGDAACAYIDVSDALSPHSAAAAGVDLRNLLWVRFTASTRAQAPSSGASAPSEPLEIKTHRPMYGGCGSCHPRGETKGVAPALEQMLFCKEERRRRKMEGTPGYPNQPLGLHTASQDQVDWERFNLRRVDETDPLRQMDRQAAEAARLRASSSAPSAPARAREQKPWSRIDGALRATDQVLQSGGFRIVVLDLASVDPVQAQRIPSATWFRYRRATQEGDAILLLLTRHQCASSSAACVLQCSPGAPPSITGVMKQATHIAEVARQRTTQAFGKKAPGRASSWGAAPAWMRAAGR